VGAFNFEITISCADDDNDGFPDCCTYTELSSTNTFLPLKLGIINNYPNPFNPETIIQFSVPQLSRVSVDIYDLKGNLVAHLVNELLNPGNYTVSWEGRDLNGSEMATGIYISILKSEKRLISHKLLLLK
jgi:hypothetical protein